MSEGRAGTGRPGGGCPGEGSQVAGTSWEGEGLQSRPEPPPRGRGWRALLVVAVGVLLAGGALLLAGPGSDAEVPEREEQDTAETAVLVQARDRCTTEFASYVGRRVGDSELNLLPVVPRENDWLVDGDRTVVCVAEGPALVGSVRGTAR